jgi:type I restriction enzyme R subunit
MKTEKDFEATIEHDLVERGGYRSGNRDAYDRAAALFPDHLIDFIQATQPALWDEFKQSHGDGLRVGLLDAVTKHLDKAGTLEVLRHGFKFYGKRIDAAYFRPAHGLNPEVQQRYAQNVVAVTRQVKFNPEGEDSVDMVLSVNGLPVATLELKNSLTGQKVEHAVRQYKYDRDPRLPLFRLKTRALVHFAVDTDLVFMTTELAGPKTRFLPFNLGADGGAGNPTPKDGSYKTGYLWREVLTRDSLLDILARFITVVKEERKVDGKTVVKESLVFPRYHQLDVVRKLEAAARAEGAGQHYLVQHSAGSGKSNSIAWSAHRLASLHDDQDQKVFQSVVVITDRRILDRQLQDTIYQFEHKQGVVVRIDKDSNQLAEALKTGAAIIITTLQKFPVVTEKVAGLPGRKYAVIVDEAHSSQSGEAARSLREVLADTNEPTLASKAVDADIDSDAFKKAEDDQEPDEPTSEDELLRVMATRGKQKNLSFFAFTATPKAKTLEVFGRPGPEGKPVPFHIYSMRQAIEEGFILDVLKSYTTYKTYYKLVQKSATDPQVKKKEAVSALARFMSLHPHNIAQKVEVIVEHFKTHVRSKLQGRAKAMVVTRSRLHAVRYKLAFDEYIKEKGYADLKALVAFSGTVVDPDSRQSFTEVGMNVGIRETELRDRFATDEYQVLLVANKYQTGFDQPLLCAMYVDKKLAGVQAVQTLSRLNRTYPGKEEDSVFVLDFANETAEIQDSFQPYYEQTTVAEQADPAQMNALQHDLDTAQIWAESELESFAKVFYRPKTNLTDKEHEELHRYLAPAVDRWIHWPGNDAEEAKEKWRGQLQAFCHLYAFMSQVVPYCDRELEIRYSFGRLLLKRLPRDRKDRIELEGEVDLQYYRLARLGESNVVLEKGRQGEVHGPTEVGTKKAEDPTVPLHEIIEILNDRFGTEFRPQDQLLFDQVIADGKADQTVQERAQANTFENFALSIKDKVQDLMIERMDRNQDIVSKYLDEDEFKTVVFGLVAKRIYEELRVGATPSSAGLNK